MTDTKPTSDNWERARTILGVRLGAAVRPVDVEVLAEQFRDSDAIARRRAIDACIGILNEEWSKAGNDAYWGASQQAALAEATDRIAALLRAPTSEKAEERKAACNMCEGAGYLCPSANGLAPCDLADCNNGRVRCTACSPPADGGGG